MGRAGVPQRYQGFACHVRSLIGADQEAWTESSGRRSSTWSIRP
ncbi:hypothetical protein [Lysobacter gummosus]